MFITLFTNETYAFRLIFFLGYSFVWFSSSVKGQSHSRSRTNHSQITHRLGLCVLVRREIDQFFGVSGIEITDESRMNHAWTAHVSLTIADESLTYRARRRIRANTVQYSTNIRRTPDACQLFVSFVSDCQWMSVEWTWYVRGSCVIWTWGVSGRTWTCAVSNQFRRISTDGRRVSRA